MKLVIEVEELEQSKLFFNESLGEGDFAGKPFEAMTAIPTGSLIVKYEGKRYMVETKKLIQTILEAVEKGA